MADSFGKKEQIKKKLTKQKEKAEKRALKKDTNNKGKSLDDMIIYVDINGHFTDVPPHLQDRSGDDTSRKKGAPVHTGRISHINEKGYGFIKEDVTKERVFYHQSDLETEVILNDKVSYQKEIKENGPKAIHIKKEY